MQASAAYDELIRRSREEALLASCAELLGWDEETYLPRAQQGSPVAMTLAFTAIPIPSDAPGDVPRVADDEKRMLYLSFLDSDPLEVWDPLFVKQAEEVEAGGLGRVIWAGAFIPTIPGTDTYTDQLW